MLEKVKTENSVYSFTNSATGRFPFVSWQGAPRDFSEMRAMYWNVLKH